MAEPQQGERKWSQDRLWLHWKRMAEPQQGEAAPQPSVVEVAQPVDVLGQPYDLGAVWGGDPRALDRWHLLAELRRFRRRLRRG